MQKTKFFSLWANILSHLTMMLYSVAFTVRAINSLKDWTITLKDKSGHLAFLNDGARFARFVHEQDSQLHKCSSERTTEVTKTCLRKAVRVVRAKLAAYDA